MKFDCPLLTMVDFCVIPSSSVCAAVSVVHKCTTTCSFVEKTASAVVEGKASVRDSYKADPEKKKASVRDSYKADPEKKKASVRDSYNADIESKQSAKRQRYQEDVEENRAAKRQKYEDNSAAIKASERNRYWNDPAVRLAKRAAERKRYRRGHRTIPLPPKGM
eukprot:Em0073g17a